MEVATLRLDHESGIAIAIDDSSQIGEARRGATAVALSAGVTQTEAGKFAILVTEAASNIVKHAGRGEIILRSITRPGTRAVEVIAIDAGPGIADLQRAATDGYSTAGSSGTGLGAISRLASSFDVFTAVGSGTVLAARIGSEVTPRTQSGSAFTVGAVRVPKRGESECGDDWAIVRNDGGRAMLVMADGLGHGGAAADASRRAVEVAVEHSADHPAEIVAQVHGALRSTRGAALAVAEITADDRTARFAGLGNISATIMSPRESKSLVSHNGIAGHEMRKIQEFSYVWSPDALLIMHSDGLSARWDLQRYPGLASHDPSVVAGVLYRDYSRERDDALIVVVQAAG